MADFQYPVYKVLFSFFFLQLSDFAETLDLATGAASAQHETSGNRAHLVSLPSHAVSDADFLLSGMETANSHPV